MTSPSPPRAPVRCPKASGRALLLAAGICAAASIQAQSPAVDAAAASPWPPLRVAAEDVRSGDVRLQGVAARLYPDGALAVRFERLEAASGEALMGPSEFSGRLDRLDVTDDGFDADGEVLAWGLRTGWSLRAAGEELETALVLRDHSLSALSGLPVELPEAFGWLQSGRFDADAGVRWDAAGTPSWRFETQVRDLAFDSPDGRFAGQGLAFAVRGQGAAFEAAGASATLRVSRGELLVDRLYRAFGDAPVTVEVQGPARPGDASASLRLRDPGAVQLDARLSWDANRPGLPDVEVSSLALEFPGAYQRYVESVVAPWDLDGLEVTGRIDWRGAWRGGVLESGDLDIRDLSVVDTRRGRFALTGLETTLRPGNEAFDSRLGWRGLLLGKVNLGSGQAVLGSEPGLIALREPLSLDVMGGVLRLNAFRYALPGASPAAGRETFISASLEDIELLPLTQALGWPEFGGRLNGELPGAHLEDGVLTIDGGIRVQVFGGLVSITDLGVERLFGVLPSLTANIDLRDLDLEQLTETFSFGRIGGRIDGYVHDLRMLDWKPVAFDAWLGTPERQKGSKGISRQAVTHLTSIGGGGPTAALSGPVLRMFNNFSYRRLGLGCRLADYVCEIRGLGDDGQGVLLMEGAGVPRITIRAYNRSIDWPQMVANLAAIAEGESIEVNPGSMP